MTVQGISFTHIPPRLMAAVIRRGGNHFSRRKRFREFESIYQKRKSIFFVPHRHRNEQTGQTGLFVFCSANRKDLNKGGAEDPSAGRFRPPATRRTAVILEPEPCDLSMNSAVSDADLFFFFLELFIYLWYHSTGDDSFVFTNRDLRRKTL